MTENTRARLNKFSTFKKRLFKENVIFENSLLFNKMIEEEKKLLIAELIVRAKKEGVDSQTIDKIFGTAGRGYNS